MAEFRSLTAELVTSDVKITGSSRKWERHPSDSKADSLPALAEGPPNHGRSDEPCRRALKPPVEQGHSTPNAGRVCG